MNKFKVGDIVTGIKDSDFQYGITNHLGTYEVLRYFEKDRFSIKVLTHSKHPEDIGATFSYVNPQYFTLYTKQKPTVILI